MTKPSAWRAFLRPAGHRLPETSCAGRAPHGPSQPPDMPNRDRSTPYRPPCTASAFPAKAFPSRSIPARVSDRPASPRHSGPTTRQQPPGSPTSPSGIVARNPQTRPSLPGICKRQSSARIASRPAACPQPTYQRALPTVSSSQEGPFPHFQRYASCLEASARKEKRQKSPALFTLQPSPSFLPGRMTMSHFKPPPASDGDRRPVLGEVFSGMGRAREGKGQFLQKTPLPPQKNILPYSPKGTAMPHTPCCAGRR